MTDIEQLYKDCYQRMLTVARQMLKNDDEASDTVSDVFARLADGSLMLPAERPESYLMVTVRHLCLDRIRLMTIHERMERRLSLIDDDPTSEEKERERVTEMIDYAKRTFPKRPGACSSCASTRDCCTGRSQNDWASARSASISTSPRHSDN